jgi:hypothetical protein
VRRPEDNGRSFASCADLPLGILNLRWVNQRAVRDNPHLGEGFDVFLMKLEIQAEVRSQDKG